MQTILARQKGKDVRVLDIKFRATIVDILSYRSYTLQTKSSRTMRHNVGALRSLLPEQHQQHHENDSNNRSLGVRI